jgi:hypothetical protein
MRTLAAQFSKSCAVFQCSPLLFDNAKVKVCVGLRKELGGSAFTPGNSGRNRRKRTSRKLMRELLHQISPQIHQLRLLGRSRISRQPTAWPQRQTDGRATAHDHRDGRSNPIPTSPLYNTGGGQMRHQRTTKAIPSTM